MHAVMYGDGSVIESSGEIGVSEVRFVHKFGADVWTAISAEISFFLRLSVCEMDFDWQNEHESLETGTDEIEGG